jgi:hypothetical protein
MSEGQHIEEFLEKYENFFNKKRCMTVVQEARKTYKNTRGAPAATKTNLNNAASKMNAKKRAFMNKTVTESMKLGLPKNAATANAQAAWELELVKELKPKGATIGPKIPNQFPDVNLTTLFSVEALNTFIAERYAKTLGNEADRTEPIGLRVKSIIKESAPYTFGAYELMFSSSKNSDCLIHTFLTATCESFRRLELSNKNAVAAWVRNYLLPASEDYKTIFEDKRKDEGNFGGQTAGEEAKLRLFGYRRTKSGEIVPSVNFLADIDIGQIASVFKINILTFENQGGREASRLSTAKKGASDPDESVYMFMNKAGSHFEAVRTVEGGYTIPTALAYKINAIVNGATVLEAVENYSEAPLVQIAARNSGIPIPNSPSVAVAEAKLKETIEAAKAELKIPAAANAAANTGPLPYEKWIETPDVAPIVGAISPENLKQLYKNYQKKTKKAKKPNAKRGGGRTRRT